MWKSIFLSSFIMAAPTTIIFNFAADATIDEWKIVNDGVMGGKSSSSLEIAEDGYGKFSGHISLENNGGFASVRLPLDMEVANQQQQITFDIKGDGKTYECRIKGSRDQAESYVHRFKTTGEWQTISLQLDNFYPQYRGRKLDQPNFNFDSIQQFGFLLAHKKAEDFELLVDRIALSD